MSLNKSSKMQRTARKNPIGIAMDVLDDIDNPDVENTSENYALAWFEVRDYVSHLERLGEERDAKLRELLRRLGMEDGQC